MTWGIAMLAIIGGMYWGIVTPTEAAGFGCLLSLVLALIYRELTYDALWIALVNSIAVTCVMSLIVINGQLLGFAIVQAGIGRGVSQALAGTGLSPFVFFVLIFLLYLALGAMLDGISMMLLTVPVLYPTLKALGFDDIWFGVILVIQAELAQLSPPIGLNLFAVQSVARDVDMATISWASLPYAVMLSALCFVLYFFPELATWLPVAMRQLGETANGRRSTKGDGRYGRRRSVQKRFCSPRSRSSALWRRGTPPSCWP